MSDKIQWPRAVAIAVAREIIQGMDGSTERLCVAGSLRRRKAEVGDVELLYIPRMEQRALDMFTMAGIDAADEAVNGMLGRGLVSKRPSVTGSFAWGKRNKLAVHRDGVPVDFFATTAENWWVSLVVRTGSRALVMELTTGAQKLGRSLNASGCGVTCPDGAVIPATSEEHVFELCGVRYREPWER